MQLSYKDSLNTDNGISLSNHICSIYQNKVQQFSQVVPFIAEGLKENYKCVYVYDENSPEEIYRQFERLGLQTSAYLESKQLVLFSKAQSYEKDGVFTIDKMISTIQSIETDAQEGGFKGLRGTAEMTWALADLSNLGTLIEYEEKLNSALDKKSTSLMCQYNEEKFMPDLLKHIVCSHPYIIIYGKVYKNVYIGKDTSNESYKTIINTIIEE